MKFQCCMRTFQGLLRGVTQEFAARYYIAILRFLKILPLQPGHMGDICSPHAPPPRVVSLARCACVLVRGCVRARMHASRRRCCVPMRHQGFVVRVQEPDIARDRVRPCEDIMRPQLWGRILHTWMLAGLAVESTGEPGAGPSLPFFSVTNFTQVGTFPTGQGTHWNLGRKCASN